MASDIESRGYANPEVLVSTDWVDQNKNDTSIRIVESDEDVLLYELGHVPNSVKVDWHEDLQDQLVRDFIGPEGFAELMSRHGVTPETTIVLYGDKNNWWAAYAYWFFKHMGHDNLKIMDGGRVKWEAENRDLTREVPTFERTSYPVPTPRDELRVFMADVLDHIGYKGRQKVGEGKPLVDVRSPGEYSGEMTHMPDYPQEGALRGGHIEGAKNIPWGKAVNEDGTFKSADELKELYQSQGINQDDEIVVYCRIGERSSHSWFVLHELLGYPNVTNYDGSWTEWGNVVGVPIER
jgi:thiosulfate/3-mercaptopyruvate sulfurtransferase